MGYRFVSGSHSSAGSLWSKSQHYPGTVSVLDCNAGLRLVSEDDSVIRITTSLSNSKHILQSFTALRKMGH